MINQKMEIPEGVTLEKLLAVYTKHRESIEKRNDWLRTEEGKAYNRMKAKEYYARHKEAVLAKRAERYEKDKDLLIERAKGYYKDHVEEIKQKKMAKKLKDSPA